MNGRSDYRRSDIPLSIAAATAMNLDDVGDLAAADLDLCDDRDREAPVSQWLCDVSEGVPRRDRCAGVLADGGLIVALNLPASEFQDGSGGRGMDELRLTQAHALRGRLRTLGIAPLMVNLNRSSYPFQHRGPLDAIEHDLNLLDGSDNADSSPISYNDPIDTTLGFSRAQRRLLAPISQKHQVTLNKLCS